MSTPPLTATILSSSHTGIRLSDNPPSIETTVPVLRWYSNLEKFKKISPEKSGGKAVCEIRPILSRMIPMWKTRIRPVKLTGCPSWPKTKTIMERSTRRKLHTAIHWQWREKRCWKIWVVRKYPVTSKRDKPSHRVSKVHQTPSTVFTSNSTSSWAKRWQKWSRRWKIA